MLFTNRHDLHSHRLILSPAEAARQRAARLIRARRAREAAALLLDLHGQALGGTTGPTPTRKG